MGLSAVFCSVLAASLVTFRSEAAEGAPFCSQVVLGTGVRLDLRRILFEDRPFGVILLHLIENDAKTSRSWHHNTVRVSPACGIMNCRLIAPAVPEENHYSPSLRV
jgi:hypothetical protein